MERKEKLEDKLITLACMGDVNGVRELINLGVDVNSRNPRNGRTALILACQMNHYDVITLLLENGADQNIRSYSGESPMNFCTNPQILQLLMTKAQHAVQGSIDNSADQISSKVTNASEECANNSSDELVLKVRLANTQDVDFIEIDIPKTSLTFQTLVQICCQELDIEESQVIKLRKLPNTKIRRDKDVERLENLQEIEIITEGTMTMNNSEGSNGAAIPLSPSNNYQSISKKDQTILY